MTTRVPNATNTDPGNKYLPALINGPETPTQKKPTPANTREHNRRLSLPTEPNFEKSPFDKNYNTLVQESPWIDPIRAGLGRIQQGLQVAGQTVSDLSGSVTELTQTGLQKSTTNPTVTTAVAVFAPSSTSNSYDPAHAVVSRLEVLTIVLSAKFIHW